MDIIDLIENNPVPWTVANFAAAMGVSTDKIYDLVKAGRLPAIVFGNQILLDPARTAAALRRMMTSQVDTPNELRSSLLKRRPQHNKTDDPQPGLHVPASRRTRNSPG